MKIAKTALKIIGILFVVGILALLIVPFLIPVAPLEGLVAPAEAAADNSQFVTIPFAGTDGIDIHYLTGETDATDEQPTFILMHGSVFNAFTWSETLAFFDDYGRVLAYDQVPYGLSEKLVEGDWSEVNPYTVDAAITQLFAFMDTMDVDTAILVGNSYGSVLALEAARQQPERVDALILADSAVYVSEAVPAALMNLSQVQRMGPIFARQIGNSEAFINQTYLNADAITPERMASTLIHTEVTDWDMALWEYLQVWGTDPSDVATVLNDITQPSLVLTGDSDVVVPVADSEQLDAALPNSELVILPDCGHVPQEECPTAFTSAIEAWLTTTLEAAS